jgi:hypothetical protein
MKRVFLFPAIPYLSNKQAKGTAAVPVAASSTIPCVGLKNLAWAIEEGDSESSRQ